MIRYVDSSGWTWEVCELAAPQPADAPSAAAPLADVRALTAPPVADRPGRAADLDPGHDPEALGELYFFSRLGTRKLRDYPASWSQLARADLEALCEVAREIGRGAGLADRAAS